MKRSFLFGLLAMMVVVLAACSSDDESNLSDDKSVVILPESEVGNEVAEFFKTELPRNSGNISPGFFEGKRYENLCYVINSLDELKNLYTGTKKLPNIDFSKHSLIIGQHNMTESLYHVEKMELGYKGGSYTLDLYVPEVEILYFGVSDLYFWCLFPKLRTEKVDVNVIKYKE